MEVTEEQIAEIVNRFLSWKLPHDFAPDGGIAFNPGHTIVGSPLWPTGTNLLDARQSREMVMHILGMSNAN